MAATAVPCGGIALGRNTLKEVLLETQGGLIVLDRVERWDLETDV